MTTVLRPYQLECIDAIWCEMFQLPTALVQAPTGSGKTMIFSHLLKRAMETKPDIRCVILMGRIDLVRQTESAISKVIDRKHIGIYCGSLGRKELSRPITIASIQSIADIPLPKVNLVIIDEAHNLDQKGGSYIRFIEKAEIENPKLKIIGFSATPFRTRGYIYGEEMLFKRLCYQKTIQDMIALGFLCRPILKQVEGAFDTSGLRIRAGEYVQEDIDLLVSNEDTLKTQVKEALDKMKTRRSVAWATANIEHCNRVLNALTKEGEYATSVHSKQNRETRVNNLAAFTGGACRHMVFVSVLSEGFDHPPIDCVVLMRPTRSPVLYVQTVGRGLRISEDKKDCLVLDYGQVVRELGPLDDPKVKGKKGEGQAVLKVCPKCQSWVPGGSGTCPDCGHEFPPLPAPEEKLTKRSDNNAKILSDENKPEIETLGPVVISMHQAKSGNLCVKIVYSNGGTINLWGGYSGIAEFFVTNSPWSMERLERRLENIGTELPNIPFSGSIHVPGTFEIIKRREGKYDRVLSVKKLSNESPENDVGFGDEEDASFDFGFNSKHNDIGF